MCVNAGTQYSYGQGGGSAWNPSTRDPVYQQVQRARSDPGFAKYFAWDIMTAKPETGNSYYTYENQYVNDPGGPDGSATSGHYERTLKEQSQQNEEGYGHLYTKHQLNASQSWVAQAFGNPVIKGKNGDWHMALRMREDATPLGGGKGQDFIPGNQITDAQTVRLLNEGHYAFSAKGGDGTEVFVPWAAGYTPSKAGREREVGNTKDAQVGAGRDAQMVDVGRAKPGNVIGGGASLLGNSAKEQERKTLLGK